jgi:hypothetical protein
MYKYRRSPRLPVLAAVVLIGLSSFFVAGTSAGTEAGDDGLLSNGFITPFMTTQNREASELFELVGVSREGSAASQAALREQEINIRFDDVNFEAARKLRFPLLDGKVYEAVRNEREGFERYASDEFTWRGKIVAGSELGGDVVFSVKGKSLSGLIYSPGAVYEIVPQADLRHLLIELDQSRFPACGGAIPVNGAAADDENTSHGAADGDVFADDGSQIDVLVTYTALVRQALGGTAQAQALAQQAIASTNTAYQNSDIATRLHLAGTLETSYDEAAGTLSAALPWVRSDPAVAAMRNTVNADLVSMIIQNASDACGIGYLMNPVSPSFESNGFSSVARSCAVGNLSFAHELGHNEGAHHNPENAGSAAFPYAYGHYVDASFRTVMSYTNQCPSGCTRVPYFSNPAISVNGVPTGVTDLRDNHRAINETALTVSQFRDSSAGTLTPTSTPTSTPTITPTATPLVIINEVDSFTSCNPLEFVELFDGGGGSTHLDGMVVVFFDGATDTSYAAFDLDGYQTNATGYFTLGNSFVSGVDLVFAHGLLQDGADAVALFNADASDFPNGTPVTTTDVIDALVYDTWQEDDPGLLPLINAGQPQVNEAANSFVSGVSMQRCPNGSGMPRNTNTYGLYLPTSDTANTCVALPTQTPTPSSNSAILGTVRYGNGAQYISNAMVVSTVGSPPVGPALTGTPGANAGQYTLTGFGHGSYTVSVSKTTGQNGISSNDAARIAQHVVGLNILTANVQKVTADVSNDGTISSNDAALIARYAAGIGPPIGITNTWRFFISTPTFPVGTSPTTRTYAEPIGNVSCQDFIGLLMGDVTGNWSNTGARPAANYGPEPSANVNLPELSTRAGKEIVVPVRVEGLADKGVISYEFDLRYDPAVMVPQSDPVDAAGTASRGLSVVTNRREPGLLRVVVYGAMPIVEDGVLLNLRFIAVGGAGSISPLTFEREIFNEGEPRVAVTDGQIKLF